MGRHRQPTNILEMHGSNRLIGRAGAQRKTSEPISVATDLTPPDWLTEEARGQWARIIPELHAMGVYGDADETALGMLCESIAEWHKISAQVTKIGHIIKSPSGAYYQNPLVGIRNHAFNRAHLLMKQFGLTPVSRAQIGAIGAQGVGGVRATAKTKLDILMEEVDG